MVISQGLIKVCSTEELGLNPPFSSNVWFLWKLLFHTGCISQKLYLCIEQATLQRIKESALTPYLAHDSITSYFGLIVLLYLVSFTRSIFVVDFNFIVVYNFSFFVVVKNFTPTDRTIAYHLCFLCFINSSSTRYRQ